MNLDSVKDILQSSYSKDTAHHSVSDKRSENNTCIGQCAITAFLINGLFWWKVKRAEIVNYWISHYRNEINWETIDMTKEQFNEEETIFRIYIWRWSANYNRK